MSESNFDNLEPTHAIEIKIENLFLTLICLNFNKKAEFQLYLCLVL